MFNEHEADDILDYFLTGKVAEGIKFTDFVTILNMKAAANVDNPDKTEILTEILNDVKLFITPTVGDAQ